ncbi:MAG: hypothetical protein NZ651_06775 [Candidatus Bipolaricaulota bacterium]|nr:hypothetical protein [Candidatus Bipolaricaulota bacterium]MDW8127458.1 hypothetical protein [Candidatus Bipolaricaulota bacterium]
MREFERHAMNAQEAHELPAGYKMTELGPLPEDWQVVKLKEIVFIGSSRTPKEKRCFTPFVPMSLIPENGVFFQVGIKPPKKFVAA